MCRLLLPHFSSKQDRDYLFDQLARGLSHHGTPSGHLSTDGSDSQSDSDFQDLAS